MTTYDKVAKTLFYVVVSSVVTGLIAFFSKNPGVFNPIVVGAINLVLVGAKNFIDPSVKNL